MEPKNYRPPCSAALCGGFLGRALPGLALQQLPQHRASLLRGSRPGRRGPAWATVDERQGLVLAAAGDARRPSAGGARAPHHHHSSADNRDTDHHHRSEGHCCRVPPQRLPMRLRLPARVGASQGLELPAVRLLRRARAQEALRLAAPALGLAARGPAAGRADVGVLAVDRRGSRVARRRRRRVGRGGAGAVVRGDRRGGRRLARAASAVVAAAPRELRARPAHPPVSVVGEAVEEIEGGRRRGLDSVQCAVEPHVL